MNFSPPENSQIIRQKLLTIIREDKNYWLANEPRRGWELYLEFIDRYYRKLGWLKGYLKEVYVPTQDNVLRRVRELKEEIHQGKLAIPPKQTEDEKAEELSKLCL